MAPRLSPLKTLFRRNRVVAALNGRRRFMGLAAFSYALSYLSFYFSYEGGLQKSSHSSRYSPNLLNGIPRSSGLADMIEGCASGLACAINSLFTQR
jgi:hypothetical protein